MFMYTIFTVKKEDIDRLTPEEAVDVFRELLWAEANSIGLARSLINVPGAITVKDGGIDAEVSNCSEREGLGIISQGLTRYQIKTGNFSLSTNRNIKSILFDNNRKLKPKIKTCLEKNGTLIIVLFGWDCPDSGDEQYENKFKDKIKEVNSEYKYIKIKIFRRNQIIGFINNYPSLAIRVNGCGKSEFQNYESWSNNDDMRTDFIGNNEQNDLIEKLRTELLNDGNRTKHIRIWGEPGIGKTRIVLEVLSIDYLKPLVLYISNTIKFRDSDLMNVLLKNKNISAILVLDDCDSESSAYIWNKFKHLHENIKIISIDHEYETTSNDITYFTLPPLKDDCIVKIIKGHNIPEDQASRFAHLCSGSPRVAHVIGENLLHNPEDLLRTPSTVKIWDRYIAGYSNQDSGHIRKTKIVLRFLSLFKRIGFKNRYHEESERLFIKIQKICGDIDWAAYCEIIKELKDRRILQGEYTLYITPKLLHIYLWKEYWEYYGNNFNIVEFLEELPETLHQWFFEMFKYAASSLAALKIVEGLLRHDGPFFESDLLQTELGSSFFLAMTEASPNKALILLKKIIGTLDKDRLLQFTTGRRNIIRALERIAVWDDCFIDAARLLLNLAEAENETYANNASGVFTGLFSLGYGRVAPTEATPCNRFPLLEEAFESGSKEKRLLVLKACDKALEISHVARVIGAEFQGLKKEPKLWKPETYGEIFDAYRWVWSFLEKGLHIMENDEKCMTIDIMLKHTRELITCANLSDMIINSLNNLKQKNFVDCKKLLKEVLKILHYDSEILSEKALRDLSELKSDLEGNSFSSLLKRYVGMDLLIDKYSSNGNQNDQTIEPLKNLSREAILQPELLINEFTWLLTVEAKNGYLFGYELGKLDEKNDLLNLIIEKQKKIIKNASLSFLGGYLRSLCERDIVQWEKIIEKLYFSEITCNWIPELLWRSQLTDKTANLMLDGVVEGKIDINQLSIFIYGQSIKILETDTFLRWIGIYLKYEDLSVIAGGIDLLNFFYLQSKREEIFNEDIVFKIVIHKSLFESFENIRQLQHLDYNWTIIAKKIIEYSPDKSEIIADNVIMCLGKSDTIFSFFHSYIFDVLDEIFLKYPEIMWRIIFKQIGPPYDTNSLHINHWLQGESYYNKEKGSILQNVPLDQLWEWIDEDIENRAWYAATFVPKELYKESISRKILIRYGNREEVRSNFSAYYSTEGWCGKASLHYREKKERLLQYRKDETDSNVLLWINEYIDMLDRQIEDAQIREEREGF